MIGQIKVQEVSKRKQMQRRKQLEAAGLLIEQTSSTLVRFPVDSSSVSTARAVAMHPNVLI